MSRQTPLEQFTAAYIEAMLWSSNDESDDSGGAFLDRSYGRWDIHPDAMERIKADCAAFFTTHEEAIISGCCKSHRECNDVEYAGHDFWLTRNGHGCGFWDGDWMEPYATILTGASKKFGGCDPYIGDDGMIHI